MENIKKAISHFNYGVKCDIFQEPVTSYAKMAISALEKQIPKKPILDTIFPSGVKWFRCPVCNHNGIEKTGAYCHSCGQALDWSDTE